MPATKNTFRGNPRHLALLTEAVRNNDIPAWNAFVRKSGSAFRPRLAGADLSGLAMGEIRLDNADLCDADLSGAVLARAGLTGARLRGSDLSGADLTGARLLRADLTNANLRKAVLSGVRARGASFAGANLEGTRLDGADLSEATLKGADVTGASRTGARLKVRVKARTDGSGAAEAPAGPADGEFSPWIKAKDDEAALRKLRQERESEEADAEKRRLDRKLGRKKPLFKRVK